MKLNVTIYYSPIKSSFYKHSILCEVHDTSTSHTGLVSLANSSLAISDCAGVACSFCFVLEEKHDWLMCDVCMYVCKSTFLPDYKKLNLACRTGDCGGPLSEFD